MADDKKNQLAKAETPKPVYNSYKHKLTGETVYYTDADYQTLVKLKLAGNITLLKTAVEVEIPDAKQVVISNPV